MGKREKPTIRLMTEQQLRIYSFPLRQKILRTMRIIGEPVTAKYMADTLNISASSARHHLMKLQDIGLVEHDHYEYINGIKANYLRVADVNVSIGTNIHDSLARERETTTEVMLSQIVHRFQKSLPEKRERFLKNPNYFSGDFLSGIAHLTDEDARQFYEMVKDFLDAHSQLTTHEDKPWEYAIMFYEVES